MRITELEITGFGRLRDLRIRLADGFNLLYGRNESGKSTILAFIQAMFYGFGRASANLERDGRRRYRPWDGQMMGGCIHFRLGRKAYQLTRRFGQTRAGDEVTLWSESEQSWLTLDHPDAPGLDLLPFAEAELLNTVLIRQQAVAPTMDAALSQRLSGQSGTTSGDDAEVILQRLQRARRQLDGTPGRPGLLQQHLLSQEHLLAERSEADQLEQAIQDKEQQLAELEQALQTTQRERGDLQAQAVRQQAGVKIRRWQELEQLTGRLAAIRNLSDDREQPAIPLLQMAELDRLHSDWQAASQRHRQAASLTEQQATVCDTIRQQIQSAQSAAEEALPPDIPLGTATDPAPEAQDEAGRADGATPRWPAARLMLSGVLILTGAAGLIWQIQSEKMGSVLSWLMLAGFLSGLLLLMLGLRQQHLAGRLKRQRQRAAELGRLKQRDQSGRQDFQLQQLRQLWQDNHQQWSDLAEAQHRLARELHQAERNLLLALKPHFGEVQPEQAAALLDTWRDQSVDTARLETEARLLTERIQELLGPDDLQAVQAEAVAARGRLQLADSEAEPLREPVASLDSAEALAARRDQLSLQLGAARAEYQQLLQARRAPAELDRQIAAQARTIQVIRQDLRALDLATRWLEEARIELARNWLPQVSGRAADMLREMTSSAVTEVRLDAGFTRSIRGGSTAERFQDSAYFSGGTADQIDLALRLAMAERLFGEAPAFPLLIDDSLNQADVKRLHQSLQMLARQIHARHWQALYVTCQPAVARAAQQMGAAILVLPDPFATG